MFKDVMLFTILTILFWAAVYWKRRCHRTVKVLSDYGDGYIDLNECEMWGVIPTFHLGEPPV